jgi:mRNA interferase HigB
MRVFARGTLHGFVRNRVESRHQKAVQGHLDAWYAEASKASWKNSAEVKALFRSASIVSSQRIVFNIKGNDYRLVIAIDYSYQVIRVIWLGTHKEYDKIDVERIEYDSGRYADSPDSNGTGL